MYPQVALHHQDGDHQRLGIFSIRVFRFSGWDHHQQLDRLVYSVTWVEWSERRHTETKAERHTPPPSMKNFQFQSVVSGCVPLGTLKSLIRLDRYLFPSTEEIVAVTWRLFLPTFYIYESISVTILFTWKEKVRGSIALHCAHLPQSRSWRWRGCIWRTSFRSLIPFWQISLFNSGGWGVQTGYNPGDRCTDL